MKKTAVFLIVLGLIMSFLPNSGFSADSVVSTIYGDLNGDGKVNSIDFAIMRSYLMGINSDFSISNGKTAGDVNADNAVNSIDFAYMRSFLLGLISVFPAGSSIPLATPTQGQSTPTSTSTPTATPTNKPALGNVYYVSSSGKSSNNGSSFENALDINTAIKNALVGDTLILQSGTYKISYSSGRKNTINLSQSGNSSKPIRIETHSGRAIIDFQFPENEWVQDSYGFYVTGNYWSLKNIDITRAGYQGVYVTGSYNSFENCRFYDNRNTGIEINKGGSYTTVINCDAFRNYDPKKFGSMADGFGPKQLMGPGNKFIGCRAWENSDDGYDCFDSPEIVVFENCWAFRNGVDVWKYGGFAGNGNGFKIGGNYKQANHKLTNCIVFEQPKKGFDQNNNTGGMTLYNCLAYNNATNFALGGDLSSGQKHILKNNISLSGPNTISNASQSNNTWNSGFSVSSSDFLSLDTSLATIDRNPDGSIPQTNLFRLKSNSPLINAGVDVGLKYNGKAPDIGAFEASY